MSTAERLRTELAGVIRANLPRHARITERDCRRAAGAVETIIAMRWMAPMARYARHRRRKISP